MEILFFILFHLRNLRINHFGRFAFLIIADNDATISRASFVNGANRGDLIVRVASRSRSQYSVLRASRRETRQRAMKSALSWIDSASSRIDPIERPKRSNSLTSGAATFVVVVVR